MPLFLFITAFSILLYGSNKLTYTLDLSYRAKLSHSLEYFGYVGTGWEDEETLKEMISDNANLLVTDFGWLGGFLLPDEKDKRKARINTEYNRFEGFEEFLQRCSRMGVKNLVGIITCTNFHEYPEWFRKLYSDIYSLDSEGKHEPLLYEIELPEEKKQFWTNIEHPILNDLKREFAQRVIERFKGHKNILVWGIDGETLYPPVSAERGFDQSEWALKHFRAYLRLKYPDIKELNEAWETRYRDFKEVIPPKKSALNKANLDWHTFRVKAIGEYLRYLFTYYKKSDPERLSFTWLHDMSLRDDELKRAGCAPFEYALIGDGLIANPIIRPPREDYNTKYFEIMTSFGKPVFSSQLAYFPRPWPGYMIRRQIYECLGLGVWSVGLVTWTWPEHYLINWGIKGTEGQKEVRNVFGEIRQLAPHLELMWPVSPAIRVYISETAWIMDGWKDSWDALHRDFLKRQIPKRYIFDCQIKRGELENLGVRVLVSLDNEIVNKETLKRLEDFVHKGGSLLIIGVFNTYDEELKRGNEPSFNKNLGKLEQWRTVLYRKCKYGKGDVIKVEGDYSSEVGDLLLWLFGNKPGVKPMIITPSEPPLVEVAKVLDTTNEKQDLAEDFSGHSSLGQMIHAPSEFIHSLSISTPTYWKKVEKFGLKMEVFLGGVDGEKMGERYFPPEQITDNGWIEIVLDKKVPKGSNIYLRITPSEPLPQATIGWWSLRIGENETRGAYVDDVPIKGVIRRVVVKYRAPEEPSSLVESFLLSDGVNMGAVLVNTSDSQYSVSLKIDDQLFPKKDKEYIVSEPLTNRIITEGKLRDLLASVSLPPYGTAVIIFEAKLTAEDVKRQLIDMKKRLEKLRRIGCDIELGKVFYEKAKEYFGKGSYSKALASLLEAGNMLYVTKEREAEKEMEVKILDSYGRLVRGASLLPLVSPLFDTPLPWKETPLGIYKIKIDRKSLPLVYNYEKVCYEQYKGDLQLRLKARKEGLEGCCELVVKGYRE